MKSFPYCWQGGGMGEAAERSLQRLRLVMTRKEERPKGLPPGAALSVRL
jgi:hypothetical protein